MRLFSFSDNSLLEYWKIVYFSMLMLYPATLVDLFTLNSFLFVFGGVFRIILFYCFLFWLDVHSVMWVSHYGVGASLVAVYGLSFPRGMWALNSLARDRTCVPCIGRQILNQWTTRKVLGFLYVWEVIMSSANMILIPGMNPTWWCVVVQSPSCIQLFWPHRLRLQHARLPGLSPSPRVA